MFEKFTIIEKSGEEVDRHIQVYIGICVYIHIYIHVYIYIGNIDKPKKK